MPRQAQPINSNKKGKTGCGTGWQQPFFRGHPATNPRNKRNNRILINSHTVLVICICISAALSLGNQASICRNTSPWNPMEPRTPVHFTRVPKNSRTVMLYGSNSESPDYFTLSKLKVLEGQLLRTYKKGGLIGNGNQWYIIIQGLKFFIFKGGF